MRSSFAVRAMPSARRRRPQNSPTGKKPSSSFFFFFFTPRRRTQSPRDDDDDDDDDDAIASKSFLLVARMMLLPKTPPPPPPFKALLPTKEEKEEEGFKRPRAPLEEQPGWGADEQQRILFRSSIRYVCLAFVDENEKKKDIEEKITLPFFETLKKTHVVKRTLL